MDTMVLEEEEHGEVKLVQGVITQPRLRIKAVFALPCRALSSKRPVILIELATKNSLVPESTEG